MTGMSLRHCQQQTCPCCRVNEISGEHEQVEAVLFGAVRYAVCIRCLQGVGETTLRDPNYQARWRRYARKHYYPDRGRGLMETP